MVYRKSIFYVFILLLVGCSNVNHKADVGFWDIKPIPTHGLVKIEDGDTFAQKISDQAVYRFAARLDDALRKKVKHGRVGEEIFSGLQVTFAAVAAAFSSSSGVHPDMITALAGLSALTPDIAGIINAGEKAKAYSQGLDLVEKALATYIAARSQITNKAGELVPKGELSTAGASLFVSVTSSLKIMRDTLLGIIPTAEEINKATGKYALFSMNQTKVDFVFPRATAFASATSDKLTANTSQLNKGEAIVVKGGIISNCSSSRPNIVKVEGCKNSTVVSIVPLAKGQANITLINHQGQIATIAVEIKEN